MSSVEGMWQFQSASVDEPDVYRWGGIVILETGRVFGGDSVMAYKGTYFVDRDSVTAELRSWSWNHDVGDAMNVFGMPTPIAYDVVMQGKREDDAIFGMISPKGAPDFELKIRMEKISDLP